MVHPFRPFWLISQQPFKFYFGATGQSHRVEIEFLTLQNIKSYAIPTVESC